MPWLAAIGGAVLGAFGGGAFAATAIGGITSMVIGGAIVGAAVGALYSAVSGGNILKGTLYGALGGAAVGYGGAALGFGGAAGATTTGLAPTSVGGAAANAQFYGTSILEGSKIAQGVSTVAAGGAKAATTTSLFANAGWMQGAGNIASLGAAFLHGGMAGEDRDAQLAFQEKKLAEDARQANQTLAAQEKAADQSFEASMSRIKSSESIATANLAEDARQFNEKIGFEKYTYEDTKEEAEKRRLGHESGILKASEYVKGESKVASVSDQNKQRRQLPGPVWYDRTQRQQPQQQSGGILQTGATA